jgi:hypothetical protein
MARTEIHSSKLPPVAQRRPIKPNATKHEGDFITGETIGSVEGTYLADLAMNEEPVTIRIEPSSEKNAPQAYPIWVNGRGAECFINGRWVEIIYLPVGIALTVKRKYLGVLISAKTDTVTTRMTDMEGERPNNMVTRQTSAVANFSILEDANPRGANWAQELRRRQL